MGLTLLSETGSGVEEKDWVEFLSYALKFSESEAWAQYGCGFCHFEGNGVPLDRAQGVRLFALAARP
jgi:hypothetical protein